MKTFVFYYLISGVATMHYTHKHYENVVLRYPILEMYNRNFILLFKFIIGFLIFPFWFPYYLRDTFYYPILDWFQCRRFNKSAPHLIAPTDEEIRQWEQERLRKIKETCEQYKEFIEIKISDKNLKYRSFYGPMELDIDSLVYDVLSGMNITINGKKSEKDKGYILVKENYYIILPEDKIHLMEGWQIACIITNPFLNENK